MATEIEGIYVKFGADTGLFDNSIAGINKALSQLKKEFSNFNAQSKLDPNNIELYEKKLVNLGEQTRLAREKLEKLRQEQSKLSQDEIKSGQWIKLQNEIDKTTIQLEKLNATTQSTKQKLDDMSNPRSIINLDKAIDEVKTDLDLVNRHLQFDSSNVDLLARKMSLLSQQSNLASIKVEVLENNLKEASKADVGANNIKLLQRELEEAKIAAAQAEKEIEDIGKASDDAANKSKNLGSSIVAGFAGGVASQAFQMITNAISDLGGEAIEASDALAKFESTMQFAGFDANQIQIAKDAVQDYASSTVYELSDVSNVTAQLAANGITNFTELTQAVGNLNAVAGGNAETFKSVSLALTQTVAAGKLTTENWNQMADAIPGASGKIQEALLNNGAYIGNFRDAMANGEITAEEFNQALLQLGSEPVAVEAAKSVTTFEGAMGNLKATVVDSMTEIIDEIGTENLTGAINFFTDAVKKAFGKIKELCEFINNNKDVFTSLAAGVAAVTAAFTAMTVIKSIPAMINSIKTALQGLTSGTIIGLIATLVTSLIYFFTQTETGKELWSNFVTWIKQMLEKLSIWWDETWTGISEFFSNTWNGIRDFFTNTWNTISTTVMNVVNSISEFLANAWNTIKTTILNAMERVKQTINDAWTKIKEFFVNGVENIKNTLKDIGSKIAQPFSKVYDKVKTALGNVWNIGVEIADSIISGLANLGQRIWQAVKSAIDWAWQQVRNFGGWIGNVLTGGGSSKMFDGNFENIGGAVASIYRVKDIISTSSTPQNNTNTFNIHVTTGNSNALDIARTIERIIVRRCNI